MKFDLKNSSILLSAVGAVNWGAAELGFNLVEMLPIGDLTSVVYYVVAAAGGYVLYDMFR